VFLLPDNNFFSIFALALAQIASSLSAHPVQASDPSPILCRTLLRSSRRRAFRSKAIRDDFRLQYQFLIV